MMVTNELLQKEAHESALSHDPYIKTMRSKIFWREVNTEFHELQQFIEQLVEERSTCRNPAEDWLLDHAEFIAEQTHDLREETLAAAKRSIAFVEQDKLRIYDICERYVKLVDGHVDMQSFHDYLQAYQTISVLSIAEVWMLPLMLRMALIHYLFEASTHVRERHQTCHQVERVAHAIRPHDMTPEKLQEALDEEGFEMPLSGATIVHLIQHLREHADDTAMVGEWLICNLENGPESLEPIIAYEHQLQAAYQVTIGNILTSLRLLTRWQWENSFEQVSKVEQTLRHEPTGDYKKLDYSSRNTLRKRVEKLAKRLRIPENLVASEAVKCAEEKFAQTKEQSTQSKETFVAYYLLDPGGMKQLRKALCMCGTPRALPEAGLLQRAKGAYFNTIAIVFVAAMLVLSVWSGWGTYTSTWLSIVALILLIIPALEWAVTMVHTAIERMKDPIPILRYEYASGVPKEAATVVVVPLIWSTPEEVQQYTERLEQHYLANREPNIHFALLTDYLDATAETKPEDEALLTLAKQQIQQLNDTYPEQPFHLFQRARQWNDSEGVWMGWERKRGKLVEFVEWINGKTSTSFSEIVGDETFLRQVKYIITLDADTILPLESAKRMIGAMHLPYNRPQLNESQTRIVEGYGVLQPRIGMSLECAGRSKLASLWSVDSGMDPYAFAVSDPYQDSFGEGIFTGKGIFAVDAFYKVLSGRIPENRVLSHDLLEGGFLRAGLMADVELIDDQPAKFIAHQKRQHRWVRGDWQLLLWLLPRVKNRQGQSTPVDLSSVTRWQMIDNLRRSLLFPALFIILLLSVTVFPGSPLRWFSLVLVTLCLPIIKQLTDVRGLLKTPRRVLLVAGQVVVSIITLPFQTVMLLDAIVRSLYRLFISKKRLLEWTSSAEVERRSTQNKTPAIQGLVAGYAIGALFLVASYMHDSFAVRVFSTVWAIAWLVAPVIVRWLDRPFKPDKLTFTATEEQELRQLARQIWNFYDDYVTEHDHYLPPDNVQVDPAKGVAHRTSPTNIGLYLTSVLAARDFGFIDTAELIERVEQTLDTLDQLETWEGHLYNWYDTVSLQPLPPVYVSTVDSGNFVGSLMVVKEGIAEWLETKRPFSSNRDKRSEQSATAFDVAFSEEITPTSTRDDVPDWLERGKRVQQRIEQWIEQTNFRPLYDEEVKLFAVGYQVRQQQRDRVYYDLIASEARQASFIAIALGQVSVAHWNTLGRTMTKTGNDKTLLSWSGTMFEYLMPWMLMRTYPNTVWDRTYRAVVNRQIEYANARNVPFGISESGYYAFDFQMNYQYKAFGVPGLGFQRGHEQELVVSSYATILAMPYAKKQSLAALEQMERLGGRGKYGFYEAIDFTQRRLPKGERHRVVKSFMAHHQGMSMQTLANVLLPKQAVDRFHRNKQVKAAELLLQERMPNRPKLIDHPALKRKPHALTDGDTSSAIREFAGANTKTPEVNVLSNGDFSTVVTNSGGGFMQYKGIAVSRWREDPLKDDWGSYIYIRDLDTDKVWTPSHRPVKTEPTKQRVTFMHDKVSFSRQDDEIETEMDICVSPEYDAEVRKISLTNNSLEQKVFELTSFVELSLTNPIADEAHPAFSKIFIKTEYDHDNRFLIAGKRARSEEDEPIWAAHTVFEQGGIVGSDEFDTDRGQFIGRGSGLGDPKGVRGRLKGAVGSVSDPAFVMKCQLSVKPAETKSLIVVTAVGKTRDEAIKNVQALTLERAVERTFQMAWNRGQIELHHFHLSRREAVGFQVLAGQILYTPPLRVWREKSILKNEKGQSSLWPHGISGDRPIVVLRVDNRSQMPAVKKLLTGHEFLRRRGLLFDLVLFNETEAGYHDHVQESLQRLAEHTVNRFGAGTSSVFVINSKQIDPLDATVMKASARIVLRAGGPSLMAQLRMARRKAQAVLPDKLVPTKQASTSEHDDLDWEAKRSNEAQQWKLYNGYGGLSADGKEYHIRARKEHPLPAPWINVMANPTFGTFISELGTGYTWWRNSRECKLTPWSNDPVLDPPGELGFLRDEETGQAWTVVPGSANIASEYRVTHGWGYTTFNHRRHQIEHEFKTFVPLDDPVKIMQLTLTNDSSEQRKLSVTYYAEWVLGVKRQTNAPFIVTEWDQEAELIVAKNLYQETFREATGFLGLYTEAGPDDAHVDEQSLSWTADRQEFLGRNRSLHEAEALERTHLSGRTGVMYEPCGAIQRKLVLAPGETKTVYIVLGCDRSTEAAKQLIAKYKDPAQCAQSLQDIERFWDQTLQQVTVSTPSMEMDMLMNGWLLYQSLACRMWARTAFYQAGGAYGYRDQLQDSLSFLHTRPDVTRTQIILHASHQYVEGDVQHWWHEETERGIRTKFSDDLLWLPYSVSRYIEHTGDDTILSDMAPYLTSERLSDDEFERYEETVVSSESGTIYEHSLRAINLALSRIGEHGIPLIGVGDWNDGMNQVGVEGKGESVWLGWFLCDILARFANICAKQKDEEHAQKFRQARESIAQAIHEHGWDGRWYRRARMDAGNWLGSAQNEECKIDAIAQSWSVISAAAPEDRQLTAMQSLDQELVDRDLNVIRLLTPPFEHSDPSPGYIQGYPPGVRENGAQYTHGVLWSIVAWSMMGNGDKAFELFDMLNPLNHTRTDKEVRRYAKEPYVMAADVYTAGPHDGRGGWTWYTGAAGWMYQAGLESILGIRRAGDELIVSPSIPSDWPEFKVTYTYGQTPYHIHVVNDRSESEASANSLTIPLVDDGKEHHVKLNLN